MTTKKESKEFITILDPQERLRHLMNYSNAIEVDHHVSPTLYYRSGLEMVRMANVYYKEGSLENAYVLYLKFMTLFLEKIRKHPSFNTVPAKSKFDIQVKLREILPKAEKLKQELLQQYKDEYEQYILELRFKEKNEAARKKADSKDAFDKLSSHVALIDVPTSSTLSMITYPDPSAPSVPSQQASTLPSKSDGTPYIDRTNKPSVLFPDFSKIDLRTVIVPGKVMVQFQMIAQKNTQRNIETCGILAGKLQRNELIITHMILPKQKGTSDSCSTMNEEELFDYQDQHNLITIGWIHTHPTQTAFLSSVDLHTHCPYQLLMPEAIAIVCAPKYNETGFFVLTQSHGLKFIANCRKTGFHPHPTDPPLFMVAEHVRIDNGATLDVLDLRTDK